MYSTVAVLEMASIHSNLGPFLGIALAAAAAFFLWIAGVRLFYRPRGGRPAILRTRCADGWELAVYHRPAAVRRFVQPVVLCHGLAANRYNFDFEPPYSLAHALASAGFDCFTVECRGTGGSRKAPRGRLGAPFCADEHIRLDAPAAIQCAEERSGSPQTFWIGHSLGGLVGLAAAQGLGQRSLCGLITLGAPVFFRADPLVRRALRVAIWAAWPFRFRQQLFSIAVAPFVGRFVIPLSDTLVNPRHVPPRIQRQLYAYLIGSVSRRLLLQLRDWNLNDAFRSADGAADYRVGLERLNVPALIIGGTHDRLAPADVVRAAYELLGSDDKQLALFGCEHGHRQNYGHGDLLFGEGAPTEVYPRILHWLETHATPLARSGS